jgi:hypothetical protein
MTRELSKEVLTDRTVSIQNNALRPERLHRLRLAVFGGTSSPHHDMSFDFAPECLASFVEDVRSRLYTG